MLDRILITNDDGIEAPGLKVLERIAAELAHEVWVVAPEHDQSGVSHAVSLHHPIRVSERGLRRYGITGTPGDCAVMGACHLMPERRRSCFCRASIAAPISVWKQSFRGRSAAP